MFAQAAPPVEALVAIIVCFGIFFVIILGVQILFLLTLMRTMKEVDERDREIQPGMVFLVLIPLFGTVWAILMVPKIARSLKKEFDNRGWNTSSEGFGQTAGSIWAWGRGPEHRVERYSKCDSVGRRTDDCDGDGCDQSSSGACRSGLLDHVLDPNLAVRTPAT